METALICEHLNANEAKIITETKQHNGEKSLWLNGIFMMAESRNRNGRIYQLTELTEAVKLANQQIKETNGLLGELDHPANRVSTALDRVSHVITEMWMDGNNACGRAKILPTPMGKIAEAIIDAGVVLGVSSRGTGQVAESGTVTQFALATIDIVTTPSAPGALPKAVYESIEEAKNGNRIITLAEAVQEDPAAQRYLKTEILKMLEQVMNR